MRALIAPRPGAEPDDHWYRFIARRVESGAVPGLVSAEIRVPRPDDSDAAGSLVVVAHEGSSGCLDVLGRPAAGALLVAPPAPDSVEHLASMLRVLLSDDPGHYEAEAYWEERGAEVATRPGGKRFYGAHEIAVLINLAALSMEIAEIG